MNKLLRYINPITRLGNKRYSFVFPLVVMGVTSLLSEAYLHLILNDLNAGGMYIIFLFMGLIIYFAFRDGIRGGVTATSVTLLYYVHIVVSHPRTPAEQNTLWETLIILGLLYLLLSLLIGWLKQTVDNLIEREADEKRRLQSVVQQLPAGVIITDNAGIIIQANKQAEVLMGKKISAGSHINDSHVLPSKQNGRSITPSQWPLSIALAQKKSIVGVEIELERKDKKIQYLQVSTSLIRNNEGRIIAAAKVMNDITLQKEMEERKDDFVNMASHELKTPITSMKLYIDSLHNRIKLHKDEKSLKTLMSIKYQTERLQELVSDLLDVSRLQTGKLGFNKEEFMLDELIHETIHELQGSTNQQRIIFSKPTKIKINADRFRIYQILTNLITNAVKYSPANTDITINVQVEGSKVIVSVKDKGIGIGKEQQKKIFDRLYQVTDQKEKTFPGLGMGLYITREIIKRHKGRIWVESEKGKGSTFYFSLPISMKSKSKRGSLSKKIQASVSVN